MSGRGRGLSDEERVAEAVDAAELVRAEGAFREAEQQLAEAQKGRVQSLTAEEVAAKIGGLRAQLLTWQALENAWGTIDRLRDEIDTYEWLMNAPASLPSPQPAPSAHTSPGSATCPTATCHLWPKPHPLTPSCPPPIRPADGPMGEDGWLTCDRCGHTWHPSSFPEHRCLPPLSDATPPVETGSQPAGKGEDAPLDEPSTVRESGCYE